MKTEKYIPGIDGLRAIAVIVIILFHLDFTVLQGGYIGVDVFFVISGFLITRLVINEVNETGKFNYLNFYIRRIRRLLPALLFTLLVSLVAAVILMTPQHLERLGGVSLHALFSVSNFFFLQESGYFNADSSFKPLLHTWSLSVEEQFYLVWPLFIVFLAYKTTKFWSLMSIVLIGFFSFLLNHLFIGGGWFLGDISEEFSNFFKNSFDTIFYLMPFRVFEFTIGAVVVWFIKYQPKNKLVLEILFLTGLAMIIYPALYYTKSIIFPSYNALLPCFGAALLIYSSESKYSGRITNNKFVIRIGIISYSLYLIHWPIIIFFKYYTFEPLNLSQQLIIIGLSMLFALLMYKYIETPLRFSSSSKINHRKFGILSGATTSLLLISSLTLWMSDGFVWRYKAEVQDQVTRPSSNYSLYNDYAHRGLKDDFINSRLKNVFIIGDSYGKDFINILKNSSVNNGIEIIYSHTGAQCQPMFGINTDVLKNIVKRRYLAKCKKNWERLDSMRAQLAKADVIILAAHWKPWATKLIKSVSENLTAINKDAEIFVVGPKSLENYALAYYNRFPFRTSNSKGYISADSSNINIEKDFIATAGSNNFSYISYYSTFCTRTTYECYPLNESGNVIIYDKGHLSKEGAQYFSKKINFQLNVPFMR